MPQQDNIAAPSLGMVLDVSPVSLKENQYPYALNAAIESKSQDGNVGTLQNDGSNLLAANFPSGYKVIGKTVVHEQERAILMLVNDSGNCIIGEITECPYNADNRDDQWAFIPGCADCIYPAETESTPLEQTTQTPYCTFHTIVNNDCLGFNINNPIRIRYKITDCTLNVYFTDDLNQRRFIYFRYSDAANPKSQLVVDNRFKNVTGVTGGDCKEPIYGNTIDCNKLAYHPIFEIPCIKSLDVVTGGAIKAGTVQALIAYADANSNAMTEYFPATNPVSVFTRQITFETNYQTDKAVKITIEDLDQTFLYSYYNVVIAETVDNFTSFKLIGTYPVTQETVLYTGNETFTALTANDVFYRKAYYKTANNITDSDRVLFFTDLTEFSKPNLQRVANNVKLWWQTVAIPESIYYDATNFLRFRGELRDEVYPFGIEFISGEGQVLGTYHIPGPDKDAFSNVGIDVDEVISNNDVIQDRDCTVITNCCDDTDATITGTITTSCSDNGCTEQGSISLDFTFDAPLANPLILHIGQIVHNTMPNTNEASGFDLFTLPPGVTPMVFYLNPNYPFEVTIPAGVTSYHIPALIHILGPQGFANAWECHTCEFPITDLYIKPISATQNITTTFTTGQSYTIHNIANVVNTQPQPDCVDCSGQKRWQMYNTGFITGTPHEVLTKCDDDKVWEFGEFSYWESTELYPMDSELWGDLCGKPIRHHKFPDSLVTHIHDSRNGSKGFSDKNIVYPIGIRVDHQSVIVALNTAVTDNIISQADRDRITSYRIVRGNRVGNKSIIAKGLIFDMWHYDKNNKRYYYANYPYNDLHDDNFISNDPTTYQGGNDSDPIPNVFDPTGRYTFHSPDVHFVNPTIGNEIKLETLEYGQSEGYFNKCELQAQQKFLSTTSMVLAFAAGVATAFSVEKEREEKVVVTRSMQNVSGTIPGAIITLPGFSGVNFLPVLPPQSLLYDDTTGLPTGLGGVDPIDPLAVNEVQRRTVRGKPYQLLDPLSGNPVGLFLQQAMFLLLASMREMQIIIDLIRSLIPYKNISIQYNSVGKYVNYQDIPNSGNKLRKIERSAYLDPQVQLVNESVDAAATQFTNVYINNWNRERSVYVKVDDTIKFPNPAVTDTSRITMDSAALGYNDLNKRVNETVSSYYASIKNFVPDQYGSINTIDYLPTGGCDFQLSANYTNGQTMVFGGDTFISRFALKRKMPFFLQTRFKFNDAADTEYSDLGNVGFPNYYFNTEQPLMERLSGGTVSDNIFDLVVDLLGVAQTRLDAKTPKAFYQNGYIHLYNYGIPFFFAESDVNVDYRHGQNNLEKDFYPHQQDLDFWLQEKNVPITEDNYYFYNTTYSKQNKEAFVQKQVTKIIEDCELKHPSLLISSIEETTNSNVFDTWLIFRANDVYEFPASDGRIIGFDGIENGKILTRFENAAKIFAFYDTLQSDAGNIRVGKGDLFNSNPREFSTSTLGFAGSQHADLLHTEFGHIWADSKRGQIFNLAPNATGMEELAKNGVKNWFKENAPFQILKDFSNFELADIDNNYKGIGLHLSFDKRFSRIFITKLDYKKVGNVTYNATSKKFFDGATEVSLSDPKYFCNKSWTISYNFITKTWVSFHSFHPNFYLDYIDYVQSGINGSLSTLWSHNLTNKSYQVYYGKLYPFIVETVSAPLMLNGILNSVEYMVDVLRYHNEFDYFYNRGVTFNKAFIFNDQQCSGPLQLNVRDENRLLDAINYPKIEDNMIKILVTNRDNRWNFNQFWDVVNTQYSNLPIVLNDCSNTLKIFNTKSFNYFKPDLYKQKIRGRQTRLQLINDLHSNYKFIYHISKQEKGTY